MYLNSPTAEEEIDEGAFEKTKTRLLSEAVIPLLNFCFTTEEKLETIPIRKKYFVPLQQNITNIYTR